MATAQPLLTPPTTFVLRAAGVGEEDLVELALARDHLDRADLDAGLVHVDEQERDALVLAARRGRCGTSTKMWSARWPADVQIFWPLITHSSPSSTAAQAEVAEVGAGVGLGVALAPGVLAGEDARQVVLLLLVGAPLQQRVAEHLDAEHVVGAAGRHAGLGELLGDDHLLERRQPGAAVLVGPARRQVAGARTASCATR